MNFTHRAYDRILRVHSKFSVEVASDVSCLHLVPFQLNSNGMNSNAHTLDEFEEIACCWSHHDVVIVGQARQYLQYSCHCDILDTEPYLRRLMHRWWDCFAKPNHLSRIHFNSTIPMVKSKPQEWPTAATYPTESILLYLVKSLVDSLSKRQKNKRIFFVCFTHFETYLFFNMSRIDTC